MNISQSINRAFNLLAASIISLAGFAFLPEAFLEQDIPDKADDALLFIVGLVAIVWYKLGANRYSRSLMPVVLIAIALAVKLMGVIIEIGDPESVGDDFGGLILFVLATGLVVYQFYKAKKLLQAAQ